MFDGVVGIITVCDDWTCVYVDTLFIFINCGYPFWDCLGGIGDIDVIGAVYVGVIVVGGDIIEELADCIHLFCYCKFG